MNPLYPEIVVQLVGKDSNALAIIGAVMQSLRNGKVDPIEIKTFQEECMSGDYNHLLQTCMKWVEVK